MLVQCKNCGLEFKKKSAEIARTKNNFCSKKCTGEYKQKENISKFKDCYVENDNGCWIWKNALNNHGYGIKRFKGGVNLAHRVSYELFNGNPNGFYVLHKCDTPKCVNPNHLFLGTQLDNMEDMKIKGRRYTKLSNEQVFIIKTSAETNIALAVKYEVCERTIRLIRNGK